MKNIRPYKTDRLIENRKKLNRNLTEEEQILWYHLRKRQTKHRFRKQVIIGNYIVDFISYSAKLIIELDGEQHYEEQAQIYDQKRTEFLNSQGFNVLRFDNSDVKTKLDNVLEEIYLYLNHEHSELDFEES
ncbi:hypothetical protein A4G18_09230 [Pasteurellaceae bacterium Pebbles2]|nr:hypothetical protein [Pasteurellaceae bacterium Pebbles2]